MPVLFRTIFICIIATLSATTVAAPTVNLQADKASYTVGDTVILVVTLSDSPLIYGGGLDLAFNPAVVSASNVVVNPAWDFTIKEGVIDNATGEISDIFFTHFSGLTGNLPVAIITLNTIASGSASITIATSTVKQFTDTGGEIVVFGTSNLASNILVNADPNEDPEESETEDTTTDQTTSEQTTTEQSTTETTTDSNVFMPTNSPSDGKERSDTTGNNGQDDRSTLNDQRGSESLTTNTQQDYAEAGSYNNGASPSTSRLSTDSEQSENGHKERSFDPATQASLSTDKHSDANTSNKKTEEIPRLLITLVFILLAFLVYKIIAYYKK